MKTKLKQGDVITVEGLPCTIITNGDNTITIKTDNGTAVVRKSTMMFTNLPSYQSKETVYSKKSLSRKV